ncbi:Uncharacterised protein [Candidatus Bilamarchaeum dharawalense]|uniref:Uncharacterized protein n=1 Tax=Candidatus Bilamarchaeum dharawalense TaxID=2885759 RepID=A0A5E4LMF8_9ARCH|nr:Uncharacterised protein [Candidatus Bilamarchaeum dharawalense]
MPKLESEEKKAKQRKVSTSYFDINQLELAIINRALENQLDQQPPDYVSIGKNARILTIQKRNLETLCRKMKREYKGPALEAELKKILSGSKVFSLFCFARD